MLIATYALLAGAVAISSPASASVADQPCNQFSWTGEDDNAHQMALPYSLPLGNTTYNTTYVTTNGTLTFGAPDANFSSYPNTPSISLAGYDWVTFGQGASLSYGVTATGFCVEWKVRPYPQSFGNLTTIKLTVDTSRLPAWSGIVETDGWLPQDLRRGIRFQSNEEVVQISEAFSINGGRPVEMQTCWDGTIIPMSATCPPEPPPGQCWDGSTVAYNQTCPPVPPDTQCWDGTWVAWSQTCPPQPQPITCWDGSVIPYNQTCPPTPPDIVCWDGQVVSWNASCRQIPPPIQCWNGSQVNWNEQCPPEPPPTIIYPDDAVFITVGENGQINYVSPVGMKIDQVLFASYGAPENYQYGSCHAVNSLTLVVAAINNNELVINAVNGVFGDPCGGTSKRLSVVLAIEVDPTYVAPTPTPEPTPTQSVEPTPTPTEEPTPTPTPSPTQTQEPSPTPTPTPEPEVSPSPSATSTPSPDPSPTETETPAPTPTPEETPVASPEPTLEVPQEVPNNQPLPDPIAFDETVNYDDLPPEQPVVLENGVILTAETVAALQLFESPTELLSAVFSDPSKALKAFASVGSDMTPEKREEAQQVIVASVVVTQIVVGSAFYRSQV